MMLQYIVANCFHIKIVQDVTFENLKCTGNFEIFVKTKTIIIYVKKKIKN